MPPRNASGFTLIELLVVIVIIATVSSLVGGFTVDRLDKMRRLDEVKTLNILLDKEAFIAFSRGEPSRLKFEGKAMYRQIGDKPEVLVKQFNFLAFDNQHLKISKTGHILSPELAFFANGKPQTLALNSNRVVELYESF